MKVSLQKSPMKNTLFCLLLSGAAQASDINATSDLAKASGLSFVGQSAPQSTNSTSRFADFSKSVLLVPGTKVDHPFWKKLTEPPIDSYECHQSREKENRDVVHWDFLVNEHCTVQFPRADFIGPARETVCLVSVCISWSSRR